MTAAPGFGPIDVSCHDGSKHEWTPPACPDRRCVRCGVPAASLFATATRLRGVFFGALRCPDSAHGKRTK